MSPGEWANLQYALLDAFGPLIHWWIVLFLALGAFNAIMIVWLGLMSWLVQLRVPMPEGTSSLQRLGRMVGMDWDW